jgi:hypothetical protein
VRALPLWRGRLRAALTLLADLRIYAPHDASPRDLGTWDAPLMVQPAGYFYPIPKRMIRPQRGGSALKKMEVGIAGLWIATA